MSLVVGLQKSNMLHEKNSVPWETLYMVINRKLFQNNVQPLPPFSHCPFHDILTDMLCTKGNRKHTNVTVTCLLYGAIT
jgi:hypothetical protein